MSLLLQIKKKLKPTTKNDKKIKANKLLNEIYIKLYYLH